MSSKFAHICSEFDWEANDAIGSEYGEIHTVCKFCSGAPRGRTSCRFPVHPPPPIQDDITNPSKNLYYSGVPGVRNFIYTLPRSRLVICYLLLSATRSTSPSSHPPYPVPALRSTRNHLARATIGHAAAFIYALNPSPRISPRRADMDASSSQDCVRRRLQFQSFS